MVLWNGINLILQPYQPKRKSFFHSHPYPHLSRSYNGKDSGCAATLLTCLVTASHACQGLHQYLPRILSASLTKLKQVKTSAQRTRLLEVFMGCIYYNAELTLQVVAAASGGDSAVPSALFGLLFDSLKSMERDFTQRLVVLSFSALLCVPPAQLPEVLRGNFPSMFQQIIRELVLIEEEAAREAEGGDEEDDEDDDEDNGDFGGDGDDDDEDGIDVDDDEDEDDDDEEDSKDAKKAFKRRAKKLHVPEGGYDEEEDCLNAEDEAYRTALEEIAKEAESSAVKKSSGGGSKRYLAGHAADDGDEDGGEEDDYLDDDGSEDDFAFTSPIENMNVLQHFLDTMQQLQQRDGGALTASLQAGLGDEDKQRLQDLIAAAQQKAATAAAATAAAATASGSS